MEHHVSELVSFIKNEFNPQITLDNIMPIAVTNMLIATCKDAIVAKIEIEYGKFVKNEIGFEGLVSFLDRVEDELSKNTCDLENESNKKRKSTPLGVDERIYHLTSFIEHAYVPHVDLKDLLPPESVQMYISRWRLMVLLIIQEWCMQYTSKIITAEEMEVFLNKFTLDNVNCV